MGGYRIQVSSVHFERETAIVGSLTSDFIAQVVLATNECRFETAEWCARDRLQVGKGTNRAGGFNSGYR